VTGIRRVSGQAHELQTPTGSVRARQVLLATGTSAVGPLGSFESTKEAMAYLETGRARGKVVVKVR
jgi:glycine/D-amino acid oxidase-like deaminating enzyme